MILIGQYDSPFVRRVGIALVLYGFAFEHRPWSAMREGDRIAPFNPLRRVPTLVLEDGDVLIESSAILDALDDRAGPSRAMLPRGGPSRRAALKVCALAMGLADKAVSLVYERALHDRPSQVWVGRCETQIRDVLAVLERQRSDGAADWFGATMSHADIAVACVLRFLRDVHPALFEAERWPALAGHAARCEAMPAFAAISQPFIPPA